MSNPVLFYFDFSSPYGYFAAQKIDETVAEFGRRVTWKPIMLGAAMKETGSVPIVDQPIKGEIDPKRKWGKGKTAKPQGDFWLGGFEIHFDLTLL